ncbi:thiol reductant ABC exporter subunit CydD [Roseomonas sp. M0104]|uniref:Thiol reductant ABC exporter subunit CydD n=1 Tax=Teichococcus coralli TaxID=2545983 RepID=A0A845BG66_9PROT|nr:thiol reductant ABC exporter subunit CydD [Pseudoroseomonas coralli]
MHRAGLLQAAAALLWVPQAALLALAVARLARGEGMAGVLVPAALLGLAGLLRAALDAMGGRMAFRAARSALAGLRHDALRALAARSPLDAGRPASGLAAAALAEQAEAVLPYLLRYRPARLRAVLVPLVLLLAVVTQSWMAALILLFAAPLIPLSMALVGLRAKEASEAQMLEVGGMNALLLDRLRGLPTIRAFDAVEATAGRLRAAAEALRGRTMAVLRIAFLSSAALELFSALGVAMVAVYVGFHLLGMLPFGTWSGWLGLGPALFVLLLAPAFFDPLRDLAAAWHDRAAGEAALEALARLAAAPTLALPGAGVDPDPSTAATPPLALAVSALVFRHGAAARPVLDGFAMQVAAGERVALFGPSGCGKSTLLALLAGLALPESGSIALGEVALTAESAAVLRGRIAWVGQQPHVFAASLRDNVRLGRAGLDAAAPIARLLPAHDPARRVGEGGLGLSGGETLRLALARAIAAPTVGVILADEPTAHLDRATAADATEALLAAAAGRTLVVATHDPVLAARMDRIVRMPA